jgi:hypothetical protein
VRHHGVIVVTRIATSFGESNTHARDAAIDAGDVLGAGSTAEWATAAGSFPSAHSPNRSLVRRSSFGASSA